LTFFISCNYWFVLSYFMRTLRTAMTMLLKAIELSGGNDVNYLEQLLPQIFTQIFW
jgi:hypothetical protein